MVAPVASAPAGRAFLARAGDVDRDGAALKILVVELLDGFPGLFGRRELHERETARTTGVPIRHQADAIYFSMRLKQSADRRLCCREIQVTYKNVLH